MNSKAEAPFSTVVCGYSGRGPIKRSSFGIIKGRNIELHSLFSLYKQMSKKWLAIDLFNNLRELIIVNCLSYELEINCHRLRWPDHPGIVPIC